MNKTLFIAALLAVGVLVGVGGSMVTAEIVHSTGNQEFCGSCHSMEPMANTFKQDVHGGQNEHGFVAECVDCHLPHDNVFNYMVDKTLHGVNDVFKETFTDTSKIDWLSRRKDRERFVFDSGCLSCHQQLLDKAEADNPKSLQTHAHYKKLRDIGEPIQCVSCHVTVGHNGQLRTEFNKSTPEFNYNGQ